MREAHERATGTPSSVIPTGDNLIDLSVSTGNDDITDVERKLKAERSARQDMEMHVTTLNSQRSVLCVCVFVCVLCVHVCACVYVCVTGCIHTTVQHLGCIKQSLYRYLHTGSYIT